MTSVDLYWLYLNCADDPSDYRAFPLAQPLTVTTAQAGEVRGMASGGTRLVLGASPAMRSLAVELAATPLGDREWLEARAGRVMCVRDDRGRKIWAAYLSLPVTETADEQRADIALSLAEVTFTDVVV